MLHTLLVKANNRLAPRLFVLLVDLTITIVAFCSAWLLRFNFHIDLLNWHTAHLLLLLGCRLLVFLYFRSFSGIIRHTSLEDTVLISKAVTVSSTLAIMGSLALKNVLHNPTLYIPISILLIEYFISTVLLIGSRIVVKWVYRYMLTGFVGEAMPVLIYGAGALGIQTKEALQQDRTRKYQILGFVDDNPRKTDRVVHGVRVFNRREALSLVKKISSKVPVQLILAINELSTDRRKDITEQFLPHQVTVKIVPSMQDWIQGQLSSQQIRDVRIEDLLGRPVIQLNNQNLYSSIQGQNVFITGAAGSIGSELVRQLIRYKPHTLVLIDQAESALHDLLFELRQSMSYALQETELISQIADVTDKVRMQHIFRSFKPDYVFHAAAYKHVPLMEIHPYEAIKINVFGTKVMADLALESGAKKFVMVSTDKAVNPTNVMGATKRLAEMYVQSLNRSTGGHPTSFIATRFGNVLGSNGSVVQVFKKQIEAGGPVTITHPEIIRYFMTIPEACQLVLEAAVMGVGGEVFVFDMGQPVRIADLARQMIRLSGLAVDDDIKIKVTGLRPGEKLYEELLCSNEATLPTHNPKIMIARVVAPNHSLIEDALKVLREQMQLGDDMELVATLKTLVPEFISNNSIYSALDSVTGSVSPN
ncbi:nucleoside-diphosphate sugar epimerase/dehydratase [Nibrella saemangeumensis]|uniref:Nucleoside-diphosphate sugar epimerase/dehydratase n=1 Tax=Nibrella saemangeumensis TaxID=1084526 RepID=A0ABP8MEZ3_9BACT